jgi:hypothetical protein
MSQTGDGRWWGSLQTGDIHVAQKGGNRFVKAPKSMDSVEKI